MRELLILSGKGGTGKTSLASSLIYLTGRCVACDYDVDASNLPLLLEPHSVSSHPFSGGQVAKIAADECTACGLCESLCRFAAIADTGHVMAVDPLACEGCALCMYACPQRAIQMVSRVSGTWSSGLASTGQPLVYASLYPGGDNSGKLVAEVKRAAWDLARENRLDLIISDGPPGIGCPVISSLVGVCMVLIVTEPTKSGFEDLKRLWELLCLRSVPAAVVVNKWDLNPDYTRAIEAWCQEEGITLAGRIPYYPEMMASATTATVPARVEACRNTLHEVWEKTMSLLDELCH